MILKPLFFSVAYVLSCSHPSRWCPSFLLPPSFIIFQPPSHSSLPSRPQGVNSTSYTHIASITSQVLPDEVGWKPYSPLNRATHIPSFPPFTFLLSFSLHTPLHPFIHHSLPFHLHPSLFLFIIFLFQSCVSPLITTYSPSPLSLSSRIYSHQSLPAMYPPHSLPPFSLSPLTKTCLCYE